MLSRAFQTLVLGFAFARVSRTFAAQSLLVAATVVVNTQRSTATSILATAETLINFYRKFQMTMLAVVTWRPMQVGQAIMQAVDHRTDAIQQRVGGHSGESLSLLCTIATHAELPQLVALNEEIDPHCFHYYHDVDGVSRRHYISPIG